MAGDEDTARLPQVERAREIDAGLRDLYSALAVTTNPIPVKAALAMTGLIPADALRLPLVPADAEQREAIRAGLESVGLQPVNP